MTSASKSIICRKLVHLDLVKGPLNILLSLKKHQSPPHSPLTLSKTYCRSVFLFLRRTSCFLLSGSRSSTIYEYVHTDTHAVGLSFTSSSELYPMVQWFWIFFLTFSVAGDINSNVPVFLRAPVFRKWQQNIFSFQTDFWPKPKNFDFGEVQL